MNAIDIHKGREYAYTLHPRRGVRFYPSAKRVRVLNVYKVNELDYWDRPTGSKAKTYVECVLLDSETGERAQENILTIRARQIVYPWEDQIPELEKYNEEERIRLKRQEEREREHAERVAREREEHERRQAEKRKRDEERKELIYELFEDGVPREVIEFNYYGDIVINKLRLEEVLNARQNANEAASSEPTFR